MKSGVPENNFIAHQITTRTNEYIINLDICFLNLWIKMDLNGLQ